MDLQMSVMNLPTKLKLTGQHILNRDLEVTRYHINLTAIVTSATSCKSSLQITKVNQKLTLLELGGELKWGYYDYDGNGKAAQKVTSDFILLSYSKASSISLILFIFFHYVSPISFYRTSTGRKNKSPNM